MPAESASMCIFSLDLESNKANCMTCANFSSTFHSEEISFVKADFSPSKSYVYLSILGPGMPSYHVVRTENLLAGEFLFMYSPI